MLVSFKFIVVIEISIKMWFVYLKKKKHEKKTIKLNKIHSLMRRTDDFFVVVMSIEKIEIIL